MSRKTLTIKTKYGSYKCVFEPDKDMGGFVVEARGVPGAISWGKNMAEAKKMAKEVIEVAIEGEMIIAAKEAQDAVLRRYSRSQA